jgi:hypothetical protein
VLCAGGGIYDYIFVQAEGSGYPSAVTGWWVPYRTHCRLCPCERGRDWQPYSTIFARHHHHHTREPETYQVRGCNTTALRAR